MVAVLALTRDGMAPPETEPPEPPAPARTGQIETDDAQLIARLDHLKQQEQLLPEPDLRLERLVRRLRVPAKLLSAAINRQTGENVSRHVNGYRIGHACALLRDGMQVTEAIYASCFNTKSNFNREFLGAPGQPLRLAGRPRDSRMMRTFFALRQGTGFFGEIRLDGSARLPYPTPHCLAR